MLDWLKARWVWLVGAFGGLVLLATVYLSGRKLSKGDITIELAKRELAKANESYSKSVKKTEALREKQVKLVVDILAEQAARAEQIKKTEGLSNDEVLAKLRARGDLID